MLKKNDRGHRENFIYLADNPVKLFDSVRTPPQCDREKQVGSKKGTLTTASIKFDKLGIICNFCPGKLEEEINRQPFL